MRLMKNPDGDFVKEVKKQIKDNGGHCPCKLEKTADTKCVCKEFRDQVDRGEEGMCHCGLWIAVNDD